MSQTKLSPEQIIAYNNAFVQSLAQLNDVAYQQKMQIFEQASIIIREINHSTAPNRSSSSASLAEIVSELSKKTESPSAEAVVLPPITENPATENSVNEEIDEFYDNLIHALGIAYENAVNSQNQSYILSQSALTQGIMQMYSIQGLSEITHLTDKTE